MQSQRTAFGRQTSALPGLVLGILPLKVVTGAIGEPATASSRKVPLRARARTAKARLSRVEVGLQRSPVLPLASSALIMELIAALVILVLPLSCLGMTTCYVFPQMTLIYFLAGNTCASKDGTGTAVTCGEGLTPKHGSTSCTTCANNGPECCVCGVYNWGTGIPFAKGENMAITDDLNNGHLNLTFTLATQPCVDRANQLSLSFRGTAPPVCEAVDPADVAICAAKMSSGGKSACVADPKCRYRIACT